MTKRGNKKPAPLGTKFLKFLILFLVFAFLVVALTRSTVRSFKDAKMFRIKAVVLAPSLQFIEPKQISYLEGKNIFSVDLKELHRRLQTQYPNVEDLKVYRRFPDKIYIVAKRRDPVAVFSSRGKDMVIDEQGYAIAFDAKGYPDLPTINGVKLEQQPVLGKHLNSKEIEIALRIMRLMREQEDLKKFEIVSFQIESLSQIQMILDNKVRVIMDRDRVEAKLQQLALVLSQGNLDLNQINYIDLRFKQPILSQH